jgi:hypothetical protein
MQGEAERALRCRPPSLPNRPRFYADSIDSAITRSLVQFAQRELTSALKRRTQGLLLAGACRSRIATDARSARSAESGLIERELLFVLVYVAHSVVTMLRS